MTTPKPRFVKDNRFNAQAEGVGQYPAYKRVDLNPPPVVIPDSVEEIMNRSDTVPYWLRDKIWEAVRETAQGTNVSASPTYTAPEADGA